MELIERVVQPGYTGIGAESGSAGGCRTRLPWNWVTQANGMDWRWLGVEMLVAEPDWRGRSCYYGVTQPMAWDIHRLGVVKLVAEPYWGGKTIRELFP